MALPSLPISGQNPWYLPRTTWDNAVAAELAGVPDKFVAPLAKTALGPAAPLTYRNVDDFGAKGDGSTDDRAAIQAAIDSAGVGGVVRLSPFKRYRVTGTLITLLWQRIEGSTTAFGSGGTSQAEIVFAVSGSTPGFRVRSYTHFKNLLIRGPGDAVGTCVGIQMYDSTNNSISLEDVSIDNWNTGAVLDQVYYGKFLRPAFRRNAIALKITSSLNISIYGIHINGLRGDGVTIGLGIQGTARSLNLFGGSIEQCRTFISMTNNESLNAYGVYFETTLDSGFTDITGIQTAGSNNTTVNLHGCYVYMPYLFSWVDSRTSTGYTLNAIGNTFIAGVATSAPVGAVAYRFTSGQIINIAGDSWSKLEKVGTAYFGAVGAVQPAPGVNIRMPVGHPMAGSHYNGALNLEATEILTLASNGPLSTSLSYGRVQITLGANLTALAFTGTGQQRQNFEITVIQDATGGRTYAWPTTCRFAGGAAPTDTTANTRTTVAFRYDGVANRWHELHRAVAVPNS